MRSFYAFIIALYGVSNLHPASTATPATNHWAFQAPVRAVLPQLSEQTDTDPNPVDRCILSRLEQEELPPSPEADRRTLARRVSLDLTGLPPSIQTVEAFVHDTRPDAYSRLVERLLESPRHGERWARWWLDVARYADSNGYSVDAPRDIWLYRDWVIHAINRDLPFDQFVIQQLAGDMLPDAGDQEKIATGFHRNTQINQEGGIDREQFRIESIVDRLATTGTAFLGLTIGCAQCHDHKYDPISQKEYYQLFAFFNNQDEPSLNLPNPEIDHAALEAEQKDLTASLDRHLAQSTDRIAQAEQALSPDKITALPKPVQKALEVPASERSFQQRRTVHGALEADDPEFKKLNARLRQLEDPRGRSISTLVMEERSEPRETHVHIKGDFTRHGDRVQPDVPSALPPLKQATEGNPNRLDFARWLVRRDNPLLARVIVNRVWQQYFGRGIVETENDFGTQGLPPSHPALLDWMAVEFMDTGWSMKRLHRLIVSSATYRQASTARPDIAAKDPANRLLARQNRLRLDAELVRDVALSVSGMLSDEIGGPSVHPPQPDGVMSLGQVKRQWKADTDHDRYRRGMYTFFFRATPHPALSVFDAPDSFSACSRRPRSNTPLQALTLLNDEGFFELAQALARRTLTECTGTENERLEHLFRLCLGRPPAHKELPPLRRLLQSERNAAPDAPEAAAWVSLARVALNLDETITRE